MEEKELFPCKVKIDGDIFTSLELCNAFGFNHSLWMFKTAVSQIKMQHGNVEIITESWEFNYWKVYLLFNGDDVVYVGCSKHLESRLKAHKKVGKIFNAYSIFYSSSNQDYAIATEKTLIRFIKRFTKMDVYNKQHHAYEEIKIIKYT